ncbi:hypothetical protein CDIK_3396 [Cucumispora dikerogammari]|nr:hypothetical protein CDIK_3396 [Cucumispora dikerogammari]
MINMISYLNYTCANKDNNCKSNEDTELLKKYHNYKDTILKIESKRLEIRESFDIIFQKLINSYFLPHHCPANIISYTDDKKINGVANVLSLKYFSLKTILKKLFFTDLISFFCDTILVINFEVKKSNLGASFYEWNDLGLGDITLDTQFSIENGINFDFLERFNETDHSWLYYWTRLEKMVFEYTGNQPDILRKCLYSELDFYLDVENKPLISNFYMFLAFFIEFSYMNINNSETETYEKILKIIGFKESTEKPFFEECFKFFLNNKHYFRLNVVYDSMYLEKLTHDFRSEHFKRDFEALKTCCYEKSSNLLTLNCKMQMHNHTISEIKKRVFYNLQFDFFNRGSSFYGRLIDFIKKKYFKK